MTTPPPNEKPRSTLPRRRRALSAACGARRIIGLTLAALARSAACQPLNRVSVIEGAAAVAGGLPGGGAPVHAGRAFAQHPGARRRGFHVVRTRAEWQALWPAPLAAPKLDFSREMVLVAFAGERPGAGYALELERLTRAGATLHVDIAEHLPAPGCPLPSLPTYPALLVAVPRHLGEVRFSVRTRRASSCLSPPRLDLDCHVENPEAPFRNRGPAPLPAVGQVVRCAAIAEPGTRVQFELLGAPERARAALERIDGAHVRLPIGAEGLFRLGVEAIRADGMSARQSLDIEAGTPRYALSLVEEEPEGARGLTLEARLIDGGGAGEAAAAAACSATSPQSWCAARADGYETRLSIPATAAGLVEVFVLRAEGAAPPQARLRIHLGRLALFDAALPDDPQAWRAGRLKLATLSLDGAALLGEGAALP